MINKTISITQEELKKCREFAEESAKSQRENRSGGTLVRAVHEISSDTLRGKVAEVAVKKFLEQDFFGFSGIELDFNIYPRGQWDDNDIEINGFTLAVKSSKSFARWLLVEKKDIDRGDKYDFYFLVLVDKDFRSAEVAGFAAREKIFKIEGDTLLMRKGECIPNTSTVLDADNHGIMKDNLSCSEEDWKKFKEKISSGAPS